MGDFSLALNEDQLQIQKWVHEFAERTIRPAAAEWDEREETPWPIIQEAAKIGLYGWESMAQFFADPTGLTMGIVNEELFWGDAGIALAIFGTGLAVAGIMNNGTPEQIMTWIPQCFGTAEDVKLGAFCVTEPGAGSDVSSLRTRAKKDGSDWVLNGTKCFITNGGIADVHVVVATVDPTLGARGQATAFLLADMATEIDAARMLVYRALWLARNGDGYQNAEGSMSKLKAGRTAVWVTERAIQILGGYGYIRDFPVERWHRDAKIYDLFEGTEQIQQPVISRAISGVHIR